MKISFSTKKMGNYPFPVSDYYRHVYFLGLWTPFCKKWQGADDELASPGFPGPTLKKFIKYFGKQRQKIKDTFRDARRRFAVRKISRQAAYDYFFRWVTTMFMILIMLLNVLLIWDFVRRSLLTAKKLK